MKQADPITSSCFRSILIVVAVLALTVQCYAQAPQDSDGDGVLNNDELTYNMNPYDPDTDGDTLPDGWEFVYRTWTSPVQFSLNDDPDNDGLANGDEYYYQSNPGDWDTDDDGLGDGTEVGGSCSPVSVDSDGDGLTDYDEYNGNGGYTFLWDSDADGMPDGFEWQYRSGLNIWYPDAYADADYDSFDNITEYYNSTDPTDPWSHP